MNNANQKLEDITPKKLFEYYESRKLGYLRVPIPSCYDYFLDLEALCKSGMNLNRFEQQTTSDNIEAICVFGSVLSDNFPRREETKRKRWFFFGPLIEKGFVRPKKTDPDDFDCMFILKYGLTSDKVILPKYDIFGAKSWKNSEKIERIIVPEVRSEEGLYGPYDVIEDAPFGDLDNRNRYENSIRKPKSLHITYRSIEQFLNGIDNGDSVSKSVIEYGIPLFGKDKFHNFINCIKDIERNVLYNVIWCVDSNGKLSGSIVKIGKEI